MAEAVSQQSKTTKSSLEEHENITSDDLTTQGQEMAKKSSSNETKIDNSSVQNRDESAKQISGNSSPQTSQKPTKIPVKTSRKQSKKNAESASTKNMNSTARLQNESSSKQDRNSHNIGAVLRTREELENELLEKAKQIDSLQKQLNDLKEAYEGQEAEKMQPKSSADKDTNTNPQGTTTNSEDAERKITLLSKENYELRERLLQKDVEIEKLKTTNEEPKVQENIVQKILRKENVELHHEKEELKLERDRLRHLVNEKQEKAKKLVAGLREMEDQLFQAKRALEDRTKASKRLGDRLTKVDEELYRYRDRYGKLEKQNKTNRVPETSRRSRSRSLSPQGMERFKSEQYSQNQMTMLQQREAKLLDDRRQLEKSVNILTNKITELEGKLLNCRSDKQPTLERGSQTDLGTGTQLTATMIQGQAYHGHVHGSLGHEGTVEDAIRKCRGIVHSLGKFFEELIQNNQDTSSGGNKSRRTTIVARRANELLHELSISMENVLGANSHEHQESIRADRSASKKTRVMSPVRRSTAVDTETLWDKLSDEVAQHEFTFDPLSPPLQTEQIFAVTGDKEHEVKRAERGLQRVSQENSKQEFTKEEATRMMNVGRKQTESVVKELLKKHQGEIRALVENACQSSPIPNVAFDIRTVDSEMNGEDEATMAVKELDCFKTRTTKVQSFILKLQEIVECAKKDKQSAELKLQSLAEEIRQKDTLLQAKSLELRRRHGRTLESGKALQAQIGTLKEEKAAILKENAHLHDVCRQKDHQILQKVQEIKSIQQQVDEREKAHQQSLGKMRKKFQEAWGLYESVKSRAEKKTAEFSEAAEKLKASQGHLLDLWQTLKTVDTVVEANEHDEL